MSADNRSTHTDALATLGTIIDDQQKRDAIHLGVEPAIAGEILRPGYDVGIGPDGLAYTEGGIDGNTFTKMVGIVDPFLKNFVNEGERFWLIVYPRQITSLRHVWEHPDFKPSGETEEVTQLPKPTEEQLHKMNLLLGEEKAVAKQWIQDYADSLCEEPDPDDEYGETGGTVTAEELIETAMSNLTSTFPWGGDYISKGGLLEGMSTSPEFWEKLAILKEIEIPSDKRNNFFSCSC